MTNRRSCRVGLCCPIRFAASCLVVFLLVSLGWGHANAASPPDTFEDVERIVAVGDIHSDHERLVDILRAADVIDDRGDFIDRGPASAKVLDLIMALEPQAVAAGGMVHALIGNHEAMNVYGDFASPGVDASLGAD